MQTNPITPTQSPATPSPLTQPTQSNPPPPQLNPKLIILAIAALLILISAGAITYKLIQNSKVLTLPANQDNSSLAIPSPTPITTDTAPAISLAQKTKVLVHHADSSFETFLIPTTNLNLFKQSLPAGDTIFKVE